jgi:hypothetical protein
MSAWPAFRSASSEDECGRKEDDLTMAARVSWPVLLALGGLCLVGPAARSQSGVGDVNYSRHSVFRIPFQSDAGDPRIKQVQLYVSTDQGQSWHLVVSVAPDQRYFDFRAQHDGSFWFAVRTLDAEGRGSPVSMEGARPGLKVVVDTQAPVVRLHALAPRDGEVGVDWQVQDDNLDLSSLRLDYRLIGGTDWLPVGVDLPANGQRYWKPATNGNLEVRLRARDRADNWNEDRTNLSPTGAPVQRPGVDPMEGTAPRSAEQPGIRLVNSKRISLNYEIKDKGPSGVSAVELWYTQDAGGRNWQKYREEEAKPPFVFDVNGEGLYGFTLVVRSGVGLSDRPPQVGDAPQLWVEVDLTKPVVHIGNVDVGRGPDSGRLTIAWTATDKNLGRQPISLSYAEQAGGTWTPIAANLENTGRYVWQMPPGIPYRFLVRVEATDKAGNVGSDETPKPVIVDLSQPKGVILGVEPADR